MAVVVLALTDWPAQDMPMLLQRGASSADNQVIDTRDPEEASYNA
jgi:hypothetical protein